MYMTRLQYRNYLRSREWKDKRKLVLIRDGYMCQHFGSFYGDLQIHHVTYIRLGAELLEDLLTLCDDCHKAEHKRLLEVGVASRNPERK